MGWTKLPVSPGDEVKAEQIDELRAAIIERRRAVGMSSTSAGGDPPDVSAGDMCYAETINGYRGRMEGLFDHYVKTDGSGDVWSKSSILQAAFGSGRTEWTRVPARAGTPDYSATLEPGDVIYTEHVNEMKAALDLMYLVPLDEKSGRRYGSKDGGSWTWSDEDSDTSRTCGAVGNHQIGAAGEVAESAPFDFKFDPIGVVSVLEVKAKGNLRGTNTDLRVKFINFVNGDAGDPQPTDRTWKAQMRASSGAPSDPRGTDTTVVFEDNLADDGSHTSDGKNSDPSLLEVYVNDYWGPRVVPSLPEAANWPFYLTFVMEDCTQVINAYIDEAHSSGRDLQIWRGEAAFTISRMWAKLDFQYKS